MKKIKKKLTAIWEVLSMAEWLEGLDRNPTNDELVEWYKAVFSLSLSLTHTLTLLCAPICGLTNTHTRIHYLHTHTPKILNTRTHHHFTHTQTLQKY